MRPLPQSVVFFERGWLSSNNVLLYDDAQAILVDTGYGTHAQQTQALVRAELVDRPLTAVFNTHLHSDHCGGNALLQANFPQLQIHIPCASAAAVDEWDEEALTYKATGQICPRFSKTHVLRSGQCFEVAGKSWQVHAAPGHDPHSVVLFNPSDGILISADALWENGFGVVFPELEGIGAFHEVGATLDLIETLAPRLVLPGHGAAFADSTTALAKARMKLAYFTQYPDKHATHAAKVLLKFKLLELQRIRLSDFIKWAQATPYLRLLHQNYSASHALDNWIFELCQGLEKSGSCTRDGDWLINV